MKKHLYVLVILAVALNACGPVYVVHQDPPPAPAPPPPPPPSQEAAPPEVSYQSFYDQLSPYGQWIDDPNYGYVWLPDAGPDFRPYATNGQWVYTEDGWTWASNYPWGWAAFHYGRWFFQNGYGWMWMPGTEWAPAWVTWASSPDYYGWAPLNPEVSVDVAYGGGYNPPPQYWCFVPHQYVGSPQINNYYINQNRNVTIVNNTTIIRNTTVINNTTIINQGGGRPRDVNYGRGPDPQEVGRYSGAAIRPVVIRQSSAPGERINNGTLAIYRPRVNSAPQGNQGNGNSNAPRIAPARVQTLNNARPVNTAVYNRPGNGNDNRGNNGRNGNTTNGNNTPGRPVTQPVNQNQPMVQPGNQQPNGRPAGNQPAVQPVGQQPYNRPVTQPINQQPIGRPGNNQPAVQPANQNQPAVQPASSVPGRPYTPSSSAPVNQTPAVQPGNQQPYGRPASQAGNQQPNGRPAGNQPAVQPGGQQPYNRPVTLPVHQQPVNQPVSNSRPTITQPVQPAATRPAPAATPPRPAPRAVPPPPPPKKDVAPKDKQQ